jgi:hypothetical protein
LLVLVTGLVLVVAGLGVRRLGLPPELVLWGATYVLFVLTVTPLHPAVVRYLLLATPLLAVVPVYAAATRRTVGVMAALALITVGLSLQWVWIRYLYILDPAPALLPFAA